MSISSDNFYLQLKTNRYSCNQHTFVARGRIWDPRFYKDCNW